MQSAVSHIQTLWQTPRRTQIDCSPPRDGSVRFGRIGIEYRPLGQGIALTDKARKSKEGPEKPSVTLPGTVEKIIPAIPSVKPEKAQIAVEGAEDLYKEIRVENTLKDENDKPVGLKPGAEVEVTIEADKEATVAKDSTEPRQPVNPHPKK
jgi:hypothetical protein